LKGTCATAAASPFFVLASGTSEARGTNCSLFFASRELFLTSEGLSCRANCIGRHPGR
jgi:hypothetical protein